MAEVGAEPRVPALRKRALQRDELALHAAPARRLPRADQPAVVDPRATRPDRAHHARERQRGHDPDQARASSGRATSPASTCGWASSSTASTTGAPTRSPPIPTGPTAGSRSPRRPSTRAPSRPSSTRTRDPGDIVRLGGVEGTFVLPDPAPEKLLFISAGSGITPIMSMLRHIHAAGEIRDVHHIHSARRDDGVIFGDTLEKIDAENDGLQASSPDDRQKTGGSGPRTSTTCARTGASARRSSRVPAR